jgi:hypothetical protein
VGAALSLMQQGLPDELRMKPAVLATRVALMKQVGWCVGWGERGMIGWGVIGLVTWGRWVA